jgi:4-hydroxybenzoyl-CoA thioesterase/acyl-CoA thioester hydrolase
MAGIAHYSSFFRYMESAEHEMLRTWGYSIFDQVDGQAISFPRVAVACNYKAPARSEDILQITVGVQRVGTKSVTYRFEFHRDGLEIALGEMTSVCCRIAQGQPPKSVPIPGAIAEKLRSALIN